MQAMNTHNLEARVSFIRDRIEERRKLAAEFDANASEQNDQAKAQTFRAMAADARAVADTQANMLEFLFDIRIP